MRGNLRNHRPYRAIDRSIPACAGEPRISHWLAPYLRVYPRVCGGTSGSVDGRRDVMGLSPRVRGNPPLRRLLIPNVGSIPACAGEPLQPPCPATRTRVYPRVCGGTLTGATSFSVLMGLSPRVRGNLLGVYGPVTGLGSIPACAGEPSAGQRRRHQHRVYPRVCGGTVCVTLK